MEGGDVDLQVQGKRGCVTALWRSGKRKGIGYAGLIVHGVENVG